MLKSRVAITITFCAVLVWRCIPIVCSLQCTLLDLESNKDSFAPQSRVSFGLVYFYFCCVISLEFSFETERITQISLLSRKNEVQSFRRFFSRIFGDGNCVCDRLRIFRNSFRLNFYLVCGKQTFDCSDVSQYIVLFALHGDASI